jgi:HAD superfamily hydrolase (TIGR01509 family)
MPGPHLAGRASQQDRPAIPDAIVFDMDGLLLDTEVLAMEALRRAAVEFGVHMPASLCLSMIGAPVDRCKVLVDEHFGPSVLNDAFFEATTRHLEAQIDAGLLTMKAGAIELLHWASAMQLPIALATSSRRSKALHHLRVVGIGDRFAAIVTRDDVPHGKPHPDLFLEAARRLGRRPQRCLALEDSYNGVRAAHAADMPVVMVPDLLAPTDEMRSLCEAVFPDLLQVTDWLMRPAHGRLSSRAG